MPIQRQRITRWAASRPINTAKCAGRQSHHIPGTLCSRRVRLCVSPRSEPTGTNSLLDLVVFGKHAGIRRLNTPKEPSMRSAQNADADARSSSNHKKCDRRRERLRHRQRNEKVMFDRWHLPQRKDMQSALDKIHELQERYKHVSMTDTGRVFNTELLNTWSLATCSTWPRS